MRLEIDLRVIIFILFLLFTSKIELYFLFFLFIFLHEIIHILVGKLFKMEVTNISFGIFGFSAQIYSYGKENFFHRIILYLSGPFCNLFFALFFYLTKSKIELIQINLILGVLNLLPILPLDGGRVLKEILKYFFGNKKSSLFMIEFTKISLIFISLIYSVAILKIKNIAILFLIIYMWWLYTLEAKKMKTLKRVYSIIEKNIEKKLV